LRERLCWLEPAPHQVFQRNSSDTASIRFVIDVPDGGEGQLEIRTSATAWTAYACLEGRGNRISGILENVPVGEHRVHARITSIRDGESAVVIETGPVFVGDLWLLAGQSNMEGCGKLVGVEEPLTGVSCFYLGDRWDRAEEPLCWSLESLDAAHWRNWGGAENRENREGMARTMRRERKTGSGLGLSFGKQLLRTTGVPIGLVMAAVGGTSMSQWDPDLKVLGGDSLYGAMLRIVQAVGGRVKGCLWYQGESDAANEAASEYAERMRRLVDSLRRDLNDPGLPFIYAQLGPVSIPAGVEAGWPEEAAWNRIQHEQLMLERELDNVALVPTIDGYLDDFIHLSTETLREIGRRMAQASARIAYGLTAPTQGPRLSKTQWNANRTELLLSFTRVNGALRPVNNIIGLTLTDNHGSALPLKAKLMEDRSGIVLCLETPAPLGCCLWHGQGLNPVVNVRDEQGYPPAVWGPLPV